MEQGTSEWLAWRRAGIGASESAALLGVCPYKTALGLYNEKAKGIDAGDLGMEEVFRRGHETEAFVRAEHELQSGLDFPPAVFEHPEFPFIRASLDGWNEQEKMGIEIKMVGKDKLDEKMPAHHMVQVQHQMLVTGVPVWLYIRHSEGVTRKDLINEDPAMQAAIFKACMDFHTRLQEGIPPAPGPRDWVETDMPELVAAVEALRAGDKAARAEALRLAPHPRTICAGAKIQTAPPRIKL